MQRAPVGIAALVLAALGSTATARAAAPPAARAVVLGRGSSAMPDWAPDGSRLVFHSRRQDEEKGGPARRNLYTVRADGTDERRLTDADKDEYHASFSPDGRKLVFVSEANGSRDLWIADADGRHAVPLTDDQGIEEGPAWSPDGRRIAYAAFPKEGGSFDLWLVNADGSGRRRLTTTSANEVFPAWHPGGTRLVYATDAGGNFDLYTVAIEDGQTQPLVVSPDHEVRPAWSPDGTKLAFSRWPAGGRSSESALWVANADGTTPIALDAAPVPATHPSWSPDGRRLAFQHRGTEGWEVWTLPLPADIIGTTRLRLAQQIRGGAAVDTVRLRGGDTLRGTVTERTFQVRAAYGAVELPRAAVAGVTFGSSDRGLARVVLANGDTLTGFLETPEIHVATGGRTQGVAVEQVTELSLIGGEPPPGGALFRAVMRNGDSLLVRDSFGPLTLTVGGRPMKVETRQIARVDFAEDGEKASVVLTGGDSLSGDLGGARLVLVLALGPRLAVHPSAVRTLGRLDVAAPKGGPTP